MPQHTPMTISGRSAVIPLIALIAGALLLWAALAPPPPPPAPPPPAATATPPPVTPTSVAFPTFPPAEIQPWDASASTDVMTGHLGLASHSHRGGGGLPVVIQLTNNSDELAVAHSISVVLLDRRDASVIERSLHAEDVRPTYLYQGIPATHTTALLLPEEPGPHYELWARVGYNVLGQNSVPGVLEIGPIHLALSDEPAGTIRSQVNVSTEGWEISATSGDGEFLDGGWAYLRGGDRERGWLERPLFSPSATWRGTWGDDPTPAIVTVLIAAPDHRAVIDTIEIVPLPTLTPEPEANTVASSFPTLEAAQQHVAFTLASPATLPEGTVLHEVRVLTWPTSSPTRPSFQEVTALYQLADGSWLSLEQTPWSTPDPPIVPGGQPVEGAEGWRATARQQYERWSIYWGSEIAQFTLISSSPDLSLEQLQRIAEGVE